MRHGLFTINRKVGRIMISHTIAGISALIDDTATKRMYAVLGFPDYNISALQNFKRNLQQRQESLEQYFSPLGIDPLKCQDVSVIEIDPHKQQIMYYFEYVVIGQVDEEHRQILNDPDLSKTETTDFGFEMNYIINEQKGRAWLAISVNIYFPWLYDDMPIPVPKHINKATLPELNERKEF